MALRTLVTGAGGRLGQEVIRYFPWALAPSHKDFDVRNRRQVEDAFNGLLPQLVIHMAGIADVRLCEERSELAWETNVVGTTNIVNACRECAARPLLLYPSTPCVFRCDTGGYTESSRPDPINYYGKTKAAAEETVLSYDKSIVFRKNFAPRARWKYPAAFVDRFGTYLFADELAFVISQLPYSGLRGIIHIAGRERLSMFELAKITTPDVGAMTLNETDLDLCADMTLASNRIRTFSITRSAQNPESYDGFRLAG